MSLIDKVRKFFGLGKAVTQEQLGQAIEKLDLHDQSPAQMEEVVSVLPRDPMELRAERRRIRYLLYRIQTQFNGGPTADGVGDTFKHKFETQPNFGGWRFFGVTWDVAPDDPYRCVHRDKSLAEEWEDVIRKKVPVILPGGQIVYPDRKPKQQPAPTQAVSTDGDEGGV